MDAPVIVPAPFTWRDGERLVRFGPGVAGQARELLGQPFVLLTTPRARNDVPGLADAARAVHHVPGGRVDELAGELRALVRGELLVALGGGRVIDVAKALAGADPPRRVAAIPTTLSGAEMTHVHRQATGAPSGARQVRPAIVLADPDLMTSAPPSALVASALNALGHAVEAPLTPMANPVATLACHQAARLLVGGLESAGAPERPELALGALLAAYGMDSAGYGLHHVAAQTVVRLGGAPHGAANAALLPHTIVHLERRFPERIGTLARVLGEDPAAAAGRLARLAGAERLRDLGVDVEILPECARAASTRPQLEATPPVAGVEELEAVYRAAW